jgi:hypothetical protein
MIEMKSIPFYYMDGSGYKPTIAVSEDARHRETIPARIGMRFSQRFAHERIQYLVGEMSGARGSSLKRLIEMGEQIRGIAPNLACASATKSFVCVAAGKQGEAGDSGLSGRFRVVRCVPDHRSLGWSDGCFL